jgi:hypothetical protein
MLISESIIQFDNGEFDQQRDCSANKRPHVDAASAFSSFLSISSCFRRAQQNIFVFCAEKFPVRTFRNSGIFSELEFKPHLDPIRNSSVSKNKLDTWNFDSVQGFCDINDHRIISITEQMRLAGPFPALVTNKI